MSNITVSTERVIDASPAQIYDVLADYQNKRARMLTPNFIEYAVEKGGYGAGTVISYVLQAANRQRAYLMQVEEPVKGSVLTERDSHSSLVTTWVLSPISDQQTRVSVTSEWRGSQGVGGFFER